MREHARALCSYVHLASLLCNVTNLFCMYVFTRVVKAQFKDVC